MCWCFRDNQQWQDMLNVSRLNQNPILYCSTLNFYCKYIYFPGFQSGKFFISLTLFLPHKHVVTHRSSWRKFLSIFLILFLWSHAFVVAEVCFRTLSSRMMKILVKFSSSWPWRISCNAGCFSELFSPSVLGSCWTKANFSTSEVIIRNV